MTQPVLQKFANDYIENLKKSIIEDLDKAPETWDGLEVRAYCCRAFQANHPLHSTAWSIGRRREFSSACSKLLMRY